MFPSPGGSSSVRLVQVDKVRSKRILAEVAVAASVEQARLHLFPLVRLRMRCESHACMRAAQVWTVLTDYDRLVEFVPNLEACERLPGGTKTRHDLLVFVRGWSVGGSSMKWHSAGAQVPAAAARLQPGAVPAAGGGGRPGRAGGDGVHGAARAALRDAGERAVQGAFSCIPAISHGH